MGLWKAMMQSHWVVQGLFFVSFLFLVISCSGIDNVDITEKAELTKEDFDFIDFVSNVENGNLERVKYFVEGKLVDVNRPREGDLNAAIHIAIENENMELLKYLVESAEADINAQNSLGDTPVHTSIKQNNIDILKYLLKFR